MSAIPWFDDFEGVAYRYYDLRMNVVPLVSDRKESASIWHDTIRYWVDPSIKIRFVEIGDQYWFIMGADSQKPDTNMSFFKVLHKSENYDRFKKGHGGEAYLRLGTYAQKSLNEVKKDALCNCGHEAVDHDENDEDVCLYNKCDCKKFSTFQVNLLKRKKTITDIKFLEEKDVKDDPLVWNCFNANKFSKEKN
ncbi:hypothetical protein Nisw_06780 [Candidatus Nitrosopumilus sp. SW]|uniref:hypothetical protein n=1 Tax=Candidatus Nitrosopumilus sp. SW TaxID=2508726 RepID=UPI00114FF258|nr:hypothetical protein [Candidatus Nitrosopumilus sp. SW]QDI89248.1 hypothetical protein Nisw_06780 [Candidatus Nitrosopumilus sp. SW]